MFELAGGRSVRREELGPREGEAACSRSPSPETAALLRSQLGTFFDTADAATPSAGNEPAEAAQDHTQAPDPSPADDPETYAFRLFSTPAAACPPLVRLAPATQRGSGAFVHSRPASHYFRASVNPITYARFAASAISGTQVRQRAAGSRWPGATLPWRVQRVVVSQRMVRRLRAIAAGNEVAGPRTLNSASVALSDTADTGPTEALTAPRQDRMSKPGKKRRLMLKKRARAAETLVQAAAAAAEEKAAAARLKRARLNRAKRARRVAKEKEMKKEKAEAVAAVAAGEPGADTRAKGKVELDVAALQGTEA